MTVIKPDNISYRTGYDILVELNKSLEKAKKNHESAMKNEPDNQKKIDKGVQIINDLERMIAEKKKFLNVK